MKTKDEVFIREMNQDDIEVLTQIFCFPWSSLQETREKWQHYYTEQESRTRTVCLLEVEGRLFGYGSLLRVSKYSDFKNANIPEINDAWISEEMRNRGSGKMLILHLEDMARREGYKQIGIGVGLYQDYGPAQALYFKLGYVPDGKGITYKAIPVVPGEQYPIDDDLILWLRKPL